MTIKKGIGFEEREKVELEYFTKERDRLQLVLNDYSKTFISRRLPFSHVRDMYRQFSLAGNITFKNGSNKSYVYLPAGLLKRVRGII